MGILLVVWIFTKFIDRENFKKIGFEIKDRFKDFIVGFGIGAIIMVIGFLILLSFHQISINDFVFDFQEMVLLILIYIVVSIGEETVMRGYFLRNFLNSFNRYIALLLSGLLFSLIHLWLNDHNDFLSILNIILIGVLIGISYTYTNNLWFPIGIHFGRNLFQSLLGFRVSGGDAYSIIELNIEKNNIYNGGDFGLESSILITIMSSVMIILIYLYYNKKIRNIKTDDL